ncbi:MAG: phosphoenolpyruvate--protein phosphotransferase [Rhizobiaceae bacterium]|nr:phosphoenolpyruvate--protein phosphotransferase [Rhizobiaceae bacterium]
MHCERKVTVMVRDGLHARPATQFVKLAKRFGAEIEVERKGRSANAKSSVKLMLLGIKESDEITLRADGEDAETAIHELSAFVVSPDAGLGHAQDAGSAQPDEAALVAAPLAQISQPVALGEGKLFGIPASVGTAIGPAFAFFPREPDVTLRRIAEHEILFEIAAFRSAVRTVTDDLSRRRADAALGEEDRAILDALIDVARDEEFNASAEGLIRAGTDAVGAAMSAGRELSDAFAATEDAYLSARAEDMRSMTRAIVLALTGTIQPTLADMAPGAIVLAEEIGAFDLAKANLSAIGAIVCLKGTVNSHVAIMARAHAIPLVVGLRGDEAKLAAASLVGVDGGAGTVQLDPDDAARATIEVKIAAERQEREGLAVFHAVAPETRGGRKVTVAANLGTLAEIEPALAAGAMGVGLLRTEFLFMQRKSLPTEDEQAETYAAFAKAFAPHAVIVRTLDVGGDKPVSGVVFPKEENPFLGWRGVRMCLERLDIFKPQLKALLRAATTGNLKVMVPMIVDVEEIRQVRALIAECKAELRAAGLAQADFDLGIMMETPAAALLAEELAREVAFFSIGTNDLTQYVMAADRLNPSVAKLNRPDHPAVMKAIAMICEGAAKAGIWVGVCGEAAADPNLIPRFVAMGVSELSMSPGSILKAKKCVTDI